MTLKLRALNLRDTEISSNKYFDPKNFDKHRIKGSIIALITIAHHIHPSKFVKILIYLTPRFQTLALTLFGGTGS